jgi:EmrB/QacA subfamily drug resistance transporter
MASSGEADLGNDSRNGQERADDRTERRIVTTALLMAMAVASLEQTVVATAMPTIIAQLRGMRIYPWVYSAYLLAATITIPLYGKLADLYGRRRVLLFGLGLFALGSMLSGLSRSMPELIAMRVLQGLGAGALGPIVLTMIGDMYTLEERAKVQGLFSGIWGGASVIGPFTGGLLTDYLSWRAVFFVTVPFGVVAFWILARHVREQVEPHEGPTIDWLGSALLASSTTVLLLAVLRGTGGSWPISVLLIGLALVLFALFVRQERRAADPVVPLDLMTQRTIAASVVGSFLLGGLLFGLDSYLPLYIQGVAGGNASDAGRTLMPMFVSWAISVTVAAKVVIRLGFRTTALVGTALIASGVLGLVCGVVWASWSGPIFVVSLAIIGLGMGPTSLSYILAVQNSVDWNRRGVATGAVTFTRTMGGALIVGLLGASLGFELAYRLAAAGSQGINLAAALRPETHALLSASQLQIVRSALGRSLFSLFVEMLALTLIGFECARRLPPGRAISRIEAPSAEPIEDNGLALAASEL